ncbi:MAG: hypothetical protein HY556_07580 [Euryarchaeota archaeon]|nr:hypothetical protein [Euryarchaeota archaeon]
MKKPVQGLWPLRRITLLLLVLAFPTFIFGTGFVLIAWIIAAVGFAMLLRDAATRRAAAGALILLSVCVLAALLLDGGIRGVPRINPSPEVQRVAGAMGVFATWYATAVFALLSPLTAPKWLTRIGVPLVLLGMPAANVVIALGPPQIPDVSPASFPNIAILLSFLGALMILVALLCEILGIKAGTLKTPEPSG